MEIAGKTLQIMGQKPLKSRQKTYNELYVWGIKAGGAWRGGGRIIPLGAGRKGWI